MKLNSIWVAILVGFLLCQTAVLWGQTPDPGKYSAEQFEVQATRGHKAAMRDGVRLSVDVFQPKAEGRFPAILIIMPYSNNPGFSQRATWFAKRGYVVAVTDSRGRFDSEGEWDPFDPKHKTDGYDLVEWLAARPWCDGKVGMMGLRNLNTGADNIGLETNAVVAAQKIYHTTKYPSHVVLPVIPAR